MVPDLVSGNILAGPRLGQQLEYLADSQGVGIVVGARVPLVLTSRADSPLEHVVSCALALQLVRNGIRAQATGVREVRAMTTAVLSPPTGTGQAEQLVG